MLTTDEKEYIINNRGQSNIISECTTKYTIVFKSGEKCSMICMGKTSIEDVKESCADRFGGKLSHVEQTYD